MHPLRALRYLLALGALCFLAWKYAPWPSQTLTYTEQNCQCQVPYNWSLKDNPIFLLEARRPYGGSFYLAVKPSILSSVDDNGFIEKLKSKLTADGYEIIQESRDPFAGQVTYTYTMRKVINGTLIYVHSVNFIAGKLRYDIEIAKKNTEPQEDAQLIAALNSFRLLSPSQ